MTRRKIYESVCATSFRFVTTKLLLSFFALSLYAVEAATREHAHQQASLPPVAVEPLGRAPQKLDLRLKHIFHHGTRMHPNLHRKLNVPDGALVWIQDEDSLERALLPRLRVDAQSINIHRLADRSPARIEALQAAGQRIGRPIPLPEIAWTVDEIQGPNYTDKETVLSFARMASNAYILEPNTGEWEDIGAGFNYTEDFGWQADGLRGHIFADQKNSTVVIGLKGTSPAIFDGDGTTTNDKVNDNLFFSCCCGQGGSARWLNVCDCRTKTYTCNSTCLITNLQEKDHYYEAAKNLYHNVTALYPQADIWMAGHSLGGAVCSLLGLTFGLPTMTFGAPGDALPAARLGLPVPPQYRAGSDGRPATNAIYHFGHDADPIFTGSCNGWSSTCSIAGYAMESVCHTGMECVYDVVKDRGWHNNMYNHKIAVTLGVLESYEELAECAPVEDCQDCYLWKYFESNSSTSTTAASSTKTASFTQTRTATCQTPGWWGCLDETTTTGKSIPTSISTTTTTTSTCKTPGWFGCKDPITTTATTESTTSSATSTSCYSFGWFGCSEPSSTAKEWKPTAPSSIEATPAPTYWTSRPTASVSSTSCTNSGLFWGCHDSEGEHHGHSDQSTKPSKTATFSTPTESSEACRFFGLFGECWDLGGASATGEADANADRGHEQYDL